MRTSVVRSPICLWCVRPGQTIFSSLSALFKACFGGFVSYALSRVAVVAVQHNARARARMFCNPGSRPPLRLQALGRAHLTPLREHRGEETGDDVAPRR